MDNQTEDIQYFWGVKLVWFEVFCWGSVQILPFRLIALVSQIPWMDNGCGHFTAACFIYIWRALAFSFLIFCSIIEWFHIKPTRYHQCLGFLLVLISNTPTTKGGPLSGCFVATNVRVYLACIVYCQILKIEQYFDQETFNLSLSLQFTNFDLFWFKTWKVERQPR